MQLSNIREYLEKYQKKLSQADGEREILLRVIKKETEIQLNEKNLSIMKGILSIAASPVIKNELFLHKEKLLQKFKENGRTDIFDIR